MEFNVFDPNNIMACLLHSFMLLSCPLLLSSGVTYAAIVSCSCLNKDLYINNYIAVIPPILSLDL